MSKKVCTKGTGSCKGKVPELIHKFWQFFRSILKNSLNMCIIIQCGKYLFSPTLTIFGQQVSQMQNMLAYHFVDIIVSQIK